METDRRNFYRSNPEGAVIAALDSQSDGLLFGAVELREGREIWLDLALEAGPEGDTVSLYRAAEDLPVLEYRARGRRADVTARPDRLLIFWNRGRRAVAVDGEPLDPGELAASVPAGVTPWLLRPARWLPEQGAADSRSAP